LITDTVQVATATMAIAPTSTAQAGDSDPNPDGDGDLASHATYTNWIQRKGSDYTHAKLLKGGSASASTGGSTAVALHWRVDTAESKLRIAVAAEATGWVGLGISEMGGMKGSDIVVFQASGPRLLDAYATGSARPQLDDQQDWLLLDSIAEDGLILFEAERKLDTGDTMDWPISDDSGPVYPGTKLIAAWGDTDEMHYHGPDQRLQGRVRFFGDPNVDEEVAFQEQLSQASEGSIVMTVQHFAVTAKRTSTYVQRCFTTTQFVKEQGLSVETPLHIIGFEWLLDPGDLIHHINLYTSPTEKFGKCDETGPHSLLYTWGRGSLEKYVLPKDVGILLAMGEGASNSVLGQAPRSFRLEIHYENPKRIKGAKDSSGVRIHYTSKLREHTAGMMQFGDPRVLLRAKPVGNGLQRHTFHCPESCTRKYVKEEGLTVLYEIHHMHKHGVTMQHVQKRNDQEIRRSTVQYYDFDQAGGQFIHQDRFKVLPGDSFDTSCNYNGTKDLIFGSSSSQEMCIAFAAYYPVSDVHLSCSYQAEDAGCEADYSSAPVKDMTLLGRWFGEKALSSTSLVDSTTSESLAVHSVAVLPLLLLVLFAFIFYVVWQRNNAAAKYKKVSGGDDDNVMEEGDGGGDDGYNCPVGMQMQGANSGGIRRRL
jgi:dopamine beta-monooxygenase